MPPYGYQSKANLKALCEKYPDSYQQHAIWESVLNGTEHIEVGALAGTGKTFTSVEGIALVGDSRASILIAFNKPIQVEAERKIKERLGPNTRATAKTFNAAGYGSCLQQWTFLRGKEINPDRTWSMLPDGLSPSMKRIISRLVDLCKNTLTEPTRENLYDLATQYDIDLFDDSGGDFIDEVLEWVPKVLERSKTPTPELGIDFNDQVWLPVIWQLPVRTYDLVIVDEAQDLNNCRRKLARMLAGRKGRIMYVGDWHQAIYGFAGSNVASMAEMAAELEGTPQGLVRLPLTVTRRCPRLVTALARQIVPDFECLDDAVLGSVCLGDNGYLEWDPEGETEYSYKVTPWPEEEVVIHNYAAEEQCDSDAYIPGKVGSEQQVHCCNEGCITYKVPGHCPHPEPKVGDMVLCRVNAPLVQLAYSCIRKNTPVKIQGKDIGASLANDIKKIVPTSSSCAELEERLDGWSEKRKAAIAKQYGLGTPRYEDAVAQLEDKVSCIKALCEGLSTVQEVLSRISVLFADVQKGNTEGFILLSSIHRAKGLESRVVRIIEPQLLPHPSARLPWQKEQEMNLKYVAITRSLDTLHLH